jgi:hypothetical protein
MNPESSQRKLSCTKDVCLPAAAINESLVWRVCFLGYSADAQLWWLRRALECQLRAMHLEYFPR